MSYDDYDLERPTTHEAKIFIKPPYDFLGVDHLITNFHLPGSTLLCLVGAFLKPSQPDGIEQLKRNLLRSCKRTIQIFFIWRCHAYNLNDNILHQIKT